MENLSKFDVRAERVAGAIEVGASLADAAREVGLAPRTIERWLARGREGRSPYRTFAERVDAARRRQALPAATRALTLPQLHAVIDRAARAGNVQAMRLVWARLLREGKAA